MINSLVCWWWVLDVDSLSQHRNDDNNDWWPVADGNDDNKHFTFVYVQPVHLTDSSVTLVNAYISHTNVTITATAVTAVMNATAVSYKLTGVLLNLSWIRNWFFSLSMITGCNQIINSRRWGKNEKPQIIAADRSWVEISKVQSVLLDRLYFILETIFPTNVFSLDWCKIPTN